MAMAVMDDVSANDSLEASVPPTRYIMASQRPLAFWPPAGRHLCRRAENSRSPGGVLVWY
jgi:hypothetical protein